MMLKRDADVQMWFQRCGLNTTVSPQRAERDGQYVIQSQQAPTAPAKQYRLLYTALDELC